MVVLLRLSVEFFGSNFEGWEMGDGVWRSNAMLMDWVVLPVLQLGVKAQYSAPGSSDTAFTASIYLTPKTLSPLDAITMSSLFRCTHVDPIIHSERSPPPHLTKDAPIP